ncbi:MAG: hypothetical protein U9R50_01300 [Campylobacterota bacterium]|nr:hypothetical protein [Campylobacterota bacterium]
MHIISATQIKQNSTRLPDEWTQEEYLRAKEILEASGTAIIFVDTILAPLGKESSVTYNPYELKKYPEGSVFLFYCDSGKATKERLDEYRKKLPGYHCISLHGGRGYWRTNMMLLDD